MRARTCVSKRQTDYHPEGPVPQGKYAMALFSEGGGDDMTRGQSASRLYGPQRVSSSRSQMNPLLIDVVLNPYLFVGGKLARI